MEEREGGRRKKNIDPMVFFSNEKMPLASLFSLSPPQITDARFSPFGPSVPASAPVMSF